jgi:hypothetical protein
VEPLKVRLDKTFEGKTTEEEEEEERGRRRRRE